MQRIQCRKKCTGLCCFSYINKAVIKLNHTGILGTSNAEIQRKRMWLFSFPYITQAVIKAQACTNIMDTSNAEDAM